MSATDTQPVVDTQSILRGILDPTANQAPATQAPEQQQAAPAQQPPAQQAPAEQPKAAEKTLDAAPVENPLEAAIESAMAPQEKIEWDDKAKAAFKSTFGAEDPVAWKSEIDSRIEQANLLKSEYEQLAPLKKQFDALPPSMQRAFQLAMEGKADEAQRYLQELPADVFLDREAKNIPSDKLLETYLPGKISKEDWVAMKDPDTDPDIKAAIESKVKHYREIASDMHERRKAEVASSVNATREQQQKATESWMKSVADSFAYASTDPVVRALVDDGVRQAFQTATFMKPFLSEDGSSLSQDSVKRYVWATRGEEIAKAQYNVGYRKGKNEGSLEATQLQPGAPPRSGRAPAVPPDNSEVSAKQKVFEGLALMNR